MNRFGHVQAHVKKLSSIKVKGFDSCQGGSCNIQTVDLRRFALTGSKFDSAVPPLFSLTQLYTVSSCSVIEKSWNSH